MIDEDQVQKSLDWLVRNAEPAAKARATRTYLEEYRKSIKADLMAQKSGDALGAQERYAYSHPEYKAHLQTLRTAVEEDEKMRWLLTACEAKIEVYRTMQANARAQGKL